MSGTVLVRKPQAFTEAIKFMKEKADEKSVLVAHENAKAESKAKGVAKKESKVRGKAIKFMKEKADKKGVRVAHENAKAESKAKGVAKKKFKVKGAKPKSNTSLDRNSGKEQYAKKYKLLKIIKTNLEKEAHEPSGVVKLSHLPEGFTDETLAEYFEQFGDVTIATICKSAKTGRSKGYAFIEFVVPEVAQIAADTMNNYILGKRLLKAEVVRKTYNVNAALGTKIIDGKYPGLQRREEHFDNFNASGGDAGKEKYLKIDSEEFKVRGMPYTFEPKEDTVTTYIETLWDEMKAMTREQIAAKDKTNEVLIEKKKKNVSSKDKKKQISSKEQKKQVLAKYQKDVLSEDRKKEVPSCSDSDKPVLEIDESDDEIEFKTPPNVIKRRLSVLKPSALLAKKQKFVVNDKTEIKRKTLKPKTDSVSSAVKKTFRKKVINMKKSEPTNNSAVRKSMKKRDCVGTINGTKVVKSNKLKLLRKGNKNYEKK